MLKKTVYIESFLLRPEDPVSKRWADFVRGFMDSSDWKQTETAFNACVNLCSDVFGSLNEFDVIICPFPHFSNVGIVHERKENLKIDLKISIPSFMAFSKYLDRNTAPETKSFVSSVRAKKLSSLYDYGYEFGLFAADAINEENWQEYLKNKSKPEREDE